MNDFYNINNNESDNHTDNTDVSPVEQVFVSNNPTETFNAPQPPNKKGGKIATKIIAGIIGCLMISAASISAYKLIEEGYLDSAFSSSLSESDSSSQSNSSSKDTESKDKADNSSKQDDNDISRPNSAESWFTLASRENALTIPEVVEKSMPSVVGISASVKQESYFGLQPGNQIATSTGTGIIMSSEGYIITNAHVVNGASDVKVILLADDSEYDAKIIGSDIQADIAVLKINARNLVAAEFGSSDDLLIGEAAIAIGNPLGFELSGSVTCGIISALNRKITIDDRTMNLIQTDAAINAGNSGGPLINSYGQVIGINSAKMSSSYNSSSIEGLGFAIPISDAQSIINDLINYGYVTGRPQLGLSLYDVSEVDSTRYNMPIGAYVSALDEEGAAAKAGVEKGDVIVAAEGEEISTAEELNEIKNRFNAGDTMTITVIRGSQRLDFDITLHEQKKISG